MKNLNIRKSINHGIKNTVPNDSLADQASVGQIIGTIFSLLIGGTLLYTNIPIFGKIVTILIVYITTFYFWYKFKTSRKLLSALILIFTTYVLLWISYTTYTIHLEKKIKNRLILNTIYNDSIVDDMSIETKVLILPFETYDGKGKIDIGAVLADRLSEMAKREKLNCNFNYWKNFNRKINIDSIEYYRKFYKADIIIYGIYLNDSYEVPQLKIKYNCDENTLLKDISKKDNDEYFPASIIGLTQGDLQGDIDFILHFFTAYKEIINGRYNNSLYRLLRIANTYNPDIIDFLIGHCYERLDQIPKAISYQQSSIRKNNKFKGSHYELGRNYLLIGEFLKARNKFWDCIFVDLDSCKSKEWFSVGFASRCLGDFDSAIIAYNTALSIDSTYVAAYVNRGVVSTLMKDEENAIKDFSHALRIKPNQGRTYVNRGISEAQRGNFINALIDYDKAIKLDSTLAEAYFCRGIIAYRFYRIENAINDYTIAIKYSPNDARYYINRGLTYECLSMYNEAICDYTKAIEIEPTNANAYYGRATAKKGLNDIKGYKSDLFIAKKLNPKISSQNNMKGNY